MIANVSNTVRHMIPAWNGGEHFSNILGSKTLSKHFGCKEECLFKHSVQVMSEGKTKKTFDQTFWMGSKNFVYTLGTSDD